MDLVWLQLLTAALGGGVVVKLLDLAWAEFRRRRDRAKTARELVDKHLDPILKAGDEFVAKLRSLAQEDFQSLADLVTSPRSLQELVELTNLVYLFAQFWARVQLLRLEGIYVSLGSDKSGKRLLAFIRTLEEKEIRLFDRAWQRAMGEALLADGAERRVLSYYDFVERYRTDPVFRRWFEPVVELLGRMRHTGERQRLLVFGAVVHALIDTLDREHLIAHERPGWGNKLKQDRRVDLATRVFGEYLNFVEQPGKYFTAGGQK